MKKTPAEKRVHASPGVGYAYYPCRIPEYFERVTLHWHDEFEISLIHEGEGMFTIGARKYPVQSGDMIFIEPGMDHSIAVPEGKKLIYDTIVFPSSFLSAQSKNRDYHSILSPLFHGQASIDHQIHTDRDPQVDLIHTILASVMHNASLNCPEGDLQVRGGLLCCLGLLQAAGRIHEETNRTQPVSAEIERVQKYIQAHCEEDLRIERLAQEAGLSPSRFMNRFVEETGQSAMEYLHRLRILHACHLLLETDLSVSSVAGECGYSNLSNFNRHFLKTAGCTPREYRKARGTSGRQPMEEEWVSQALEGTGN